MTTNHETLRLVSLPHGCVLRTYEADGNRLGYVLADKAGHVIFSGEDFGSSPQHAIDSDDALRSLLGFLTLRPGDTDESYFSDYTPAQLAFAGSAAAEEIRIIHTLEPNPGEEPAEFVDAEDWVELPYEHYGLPTFSYDGEEFAWAEDDDAADAAAKEAATESLWAFRSEFLSGYIPALRNTRAHFAFDKLRGSLCEDANELVAAMLGDNLDRMLADAIGCDGRGHFLASYDGEERDATCCRPGFIYRIN